MKTVNKIHLGTTWVVSGALTAGELNIYSEYTGNGAFFFNGEKDAAWENTCQGYEKVKKLDADKNQLVWLTPAPANNTWTIAVRQDIAQQNQLSSLEDLSCYLKKRWHQAGGLGGVYRERGGALPAFEKAYDYKFTQSQLLSLAGSGAADLRRQRSNGLRHRRPGGGARPANPERSQRRSADLCASAGDPRLGAESLSRY